MGYEAFGIMIALHIFGILIGYKARGKIDSYREYKEDRDFEARIKAQENIPSYPTPTPKLKEAERLMREYAERQKELSRLKDAWGPR